MVSRKGPRKRSKRSETGGEEDRPRRPHNLRESLFSFKGRDFISPDDFTKEELEYLVETGIRVKKDWNDPAKVDDRQSRLKGKRAYFLFREPSSRTFTSSQTASLLQGAEVCQMIGEEANSFAKGEPWRDWFEQLGRDHGFNYYVVRTKQEGAPRFASQVLRRLSEKLGRPHAPVVNGGDGRHWHPTQGSLDHQFAYTVFCPEGHWNGMNARTICYGGDLANSRTVHTNMRNWMRYPSVRFVFVAIEGMRMPRDYLSMLDAKEITYKEVDCFDRSLLSTVDNVYLARPQKERWEKGLTPAQKQDYARAITLRKSYLPFHPRSSPCGRYSLPIVFHALPRDKAFPEMDEDLIDSPFWGGYDESNEGIYNRAGLFNLITGVPGFGDELPVRAEKKGEAGKTIFEVEEGILKTRSNDQVGPITAGYVLDHISDDTDLFRGILGMLPHPMGRTSNARVVSNKRSTHSKTGWKYIAKIEEPGLEEIGDDHLPSMATPALPKELAERIALMDPEIVINIIKSGVVKYKMHAVIPNLVVGRISCVNEACISHPLQMEHAPSEFYIENKRAGLYRCGFCDTVADARSL